jgi:hypothetical protein
MFVLLVYFLTLLKLNANVCHKMLKLCGMW